jgi:hypothetical protein
MRVSERVRVVLDIDRTERAISGHLSVDGAAAVEFFGWLELIDGIERAAVHGSSSALIDGSVNGDTERAS